MTSSATPTSMLGVEQTIGSAFSGVGVSGKSGAVQIQQDIIASITTNDDVPRCLAQTHADAVLHHTKIVTDQSQSRQPSDRYPVWN